MDGTRVRHAAKLYRPALENRAYLELARLLPTRYCAATASPAVTAVRSCCCPDTSPATAH